MAKKAKQEVVEEVVAVATKPQPKPVKKNNWEVKDRVYILKNGQDRKSVG